MAVVPTPESAFPHPGRFETRPMPDGVADATHFSVRTPASDGMSLRDYIACAALSGGAWDTDASGKMPPLPVIAGTCYMLADEMLKASRRPS